MAGLVLVGLLALAPAAPQDAPPKTGPGQGAPGLAPPLAAPDGKLELSLEECVRTVLERNNLLRIARVANEENRASIEQALGSFDPELYANATGVNAEQPTASSFQAPKNQSLSGSLGLRGLYRSGLTYDLGYQLRYNRQSPTNAFFGLNPTLTSDVTLNLSQPLLRGFGSTVTEAPVEQARLLVVRGDLDVYTQMQQTAYGAIAAYWNLVRARRERDTARTARDVADELVSNNQKRLDAGTMTRIDVLTAQAEAARRKEALIRAENAVGGAEDGLKILLSPGVALRDWRMAIEPTTEPELRDEPAADEESAVATALQSRSDLRTLDFELRAADLSLEVARDQTRPRLDLSGSYGYAGLAGNSTGPGSKTNVRLWANSLEAIRDRDSPTWSLGFTFTQSLGNRTAAAAERSAALEKQRVAMLHDQKVMEIVQEMRAALRDVGDARASAAAATQARVLAQEQYQAELIRLENQHSTTFQVREAQRDLFQAQDLETGAITQYEVLRAALERARGSLAQRFGVSFEPDLPPEGALRP